MLFWCFAFKKLDDHMKSDQLKIRLGKTSEVVDGAKAETLRRSTTRVKTGTHLKRVEAA